MFWGKQASQGQDGQPCLPHGLREESSQGLLSTEEGPARSGVISIRGQDLDALQWERRPPARGPLPAFPPRTCYTWLPDSQRWPWGTYLPRPGPSPQRCLTRQPQQHPAASAEPCKARKKRKLSLTLASLNESEGRSVVSDSLQPHGLYGPWDSPGQNSGVGSLSLLQGILPTQESNQGLLHYRRSLPH